AARLEDGHGERVAHDEHGGGAGGRGEVEGAGFARHLHVQHHVPVPRERGPGHAGDGDDLDGKTLQRGQEVEQLLRFAGVTEGEDEITITHDAEVAVQGVHAVEDDAGGAGAGEGGGDFAADVAGLADADDDDFAAAAQGVGGKLHGG